MDAAEIVALATDRRFITSVLVAICVIATVVTLAMPLVSTDSLARRMKSVGAERERIRARERAAAKSGGGLRHQQNLNYMRDVVDRFSLSKWLAADNSKMRLAQAGYRGPQAETAFLFFRLVTPIGLASTAALYLFVIDDFNLSLALRAGIVVLGAYIGVKAPELFLSNAIQKRQFNMKRALPDALDLLLICVESGMSIEHAFRKVSQEIGGQSVELAEECALATAELSYLPDRRGAYQNLAMRTGLDGVKQISTVLVQAEKYGTPLGAALRATAQESRDNRMIEAEKMAAALPPKLTVPMIVFFLPVLLVVVIAPAIMQVMALGF
jgi:tight adherence protein C